MNKSIAIFLITLLAATCVEGESYLRSKESVGSNERELSTKEKKKTKKGPPQPNPGLKIAAEKLPVGEDELKDKEKEDGEDLKDLDMVKQQKEDNWNSWHNMWQSWTQDKAQKWEDFQEEKTQKWVDWKDEKRNKYDAKKKEKEDRKKEMKKKDDADYDFHHDFKKDDKKKKKDDKKKKKKKEDEYDYADYYPDYDEGNSKDKDYDYDYEYDDGADKPWWHFKGKHGGGGGGGNGGGSGDDDGTSPWWDFMRPCVFLKDQFDEDSVDCEIDFLSPWLKDRQIKFKLEATEESCQENRRHDKEVCGTAGYQGSLDFDDSVHNSTVYYKDVTVGNVKLGTFALSAYMCKNFSQDSTFLGLDLPAPSFCGCDVRIGDNLCSHCGPCSNGGFEFDCRNLVSGLQLGNTNCTDIDVFTNLRALPGEALKTKSTKLPSFLLGDIELLSDGEAADDGGLVDLGSAAKPVLRTGGD